VISKWGEKEGGERGWGGDRRLGGFLPHNFINKITLEDSDSSHRVGGPIPYRAAGAQRAPA